MKIFDFNIHLPRKLSTDVNDVIDDDLNLTADALVTGLSHHYQEISTVSRINVLLFNQRLFSQSQDLTPFTEQLDSKFEGFMLTALINFRDPHVMDYLERARSVTRSVMFNSYLQQIGDDDFKTVLEVCKFAEQHGMIICIDGSYGTSKMYTYDNMKLACFVADHISTAPIVLIHSGGARIIDAMWLALDKKNVFLETSFSLNYYLGSSLEQDYAFAYKRVGASRVLFGSDVPYVSFEEAFNRQLDFFRRHDFSETEINAMFYENALRLLNG
jgi:uncharacterized protein